MKTKLFCILLALVFAVGCFSACGKTEPAADKAASDVGTEEDGQNPVMNFIGNYQSDRRTMLVEAKGMDEAKVTVHWGSDAWTHSEWTMTGKIVEEGDGLVMQYTDGTYATVTTDESGNETRSDETTGGTGTVWFNSDYTITWTDDQDERLKEVVFEWIPVVSEDEAVDTTLVGSWSDGDDLKYVFNVDGSGSLTQVKADLSVSFQYELDAENGKIVFHMGSAEDNTPASYSMTDGTHMTLTYDDGRIVDLSLTD